MPVNDFVIKNEAAALRARADALLVVVIMPNHVFYSVDPKMRASDVERVLVDEASTVADHIAADRAKGGKR